MDDLTVCIKYTPGFASRRAKLGALLASIRRYHGPAVPILVATEGESLGSPYVQMQRDGLVGSDPFETPTRLNRGPFCSDPFETPTRLNRGPFGRKATVRFSPSCSVLTHCAPVRRAATAMSADHSSSC